MMMNRVSAVTLGPSAVTLGPSKEAPLPTVQRRGYVANTMVPRPPITAEQLERLGSAYHDFELVRGELVPMTPPGAEHGILAVALASELRRVVHPRGVGHVYVETGYTLFRTPDGVRGPDVRFRSSAHATG